ncbi:MAG: glycosyltransferase family 2 protein [Pedobacter sp.]|nr:MAG: glycosyltransferase family 2 protein [Pedobacter sp.]
MKIAVLLATFNRKDKTIACLKSLLSQKFSFKVEFEVFLTDDSSSDGTAEAVAQIWPDANILHGSGKLFWAGGMRNSWNEALKCGADFYLLLNDDTLLKGHAIQALLESYEKILEEKQLQSIVIGSTSEFENNTISYGGKKLISKYKINYSDVYSEEDVLECDLGNANIMLVPDSVVERIGILSSAYSHGIADFDYTLNAKRHGFGVHVAPGILGACSDDHGNNWKSQKTTLSERIKFLKSPKGLAYKEYLHLTRKFFPMSLPETFVKLWLKTFFPVIWDKFKV